MERKCLHSCECRRCLDRTRPFPGLWRDDAFLNGAERNGYRSLSATGPRAFPSYQASYSKGENRVRFASHRGQSLPLPTIPDETLNQNPRFDETFPKVCVPHQNPCYLRPHPSEIERELIQKNNLVREQQRQLDELRSRMVIPVLPDTQPPLMSMPLNLSDDTRRGHHDNGLPVHDNNYCNQSSNHGIPTTNKHPYRDRAVRSGGSFDRRGEDLRVERLGRARRDRSTTRFHRDRRPGNSLNRNNNNNNHSRRYSASDTDTYESEDRYDDDDEEEDDNDAGGAPLLRNDGNENANQTALLYGGASTKRTSNPDVVVVEDRCCGTCCAIAAIVTCGVLVILIVYPIIYLVKHSTIHF